MTVDFLQIYWKDEQITKLYDFGTPYRNEVLTKYFENSVIADLVPSINEDLIGIASWRLREKRNDSSTEGILKRAHGHTDLTLERILAHEFDIAVLTPRNNLHDMLNAAIGYHGIAWVEAFTVFKRYLRSAHNIRVPEKLDNCIYENHFIAKREIYHEYVDKILKPAMEYMETEPIYQTSADYAKRKRAHEVDEYRQKTGLQDWCIGVFILERLFSIWIHGKKFKLVNL